MKQYRVTGMSCAACSARVEKAVSGLPGVSGCAVNLLTGFMSVEGNVPAEDVVNAVRKAGYDAEPDIRGGGAAEKSIRKTGPEDEIKPLKRRLIFSAVFLLILMYFSMGHMMWGFPLPDVLERNPAAQGLLQLLLSEGIMVINQKYFISGFKGLMHRAPNMDTLVAMGASAAFIYSTAALFAMTGLQAEGNTAAAGGYVHEFYFEAAGVILTLITLGKMLEARSKGKTTNALKELINLAPKTAALFADGEEKRIPAEQLKKGDIFAVRPGESIPADGIVVFGSSTVNESALTGESIPADKTVGDRVLSASINQSGYIRCEALKVGEETAFSKIISLVSDASATKAPIARIADKISGIFVPAVIAVASVTVLIWLLAGESTGFALARGISVLVISCPCALGLATPVAIMTGSGTAAKNGILYKSAEALEEAGRAETVLLDKTGTVTEGKPGVTDIIPEPGVTEEELIFKACSLESKSEHPLASAIMEEAERRNIKPAETFNFRVMPGNGLAAELPGAELQAAGISGGNYSFISERADIPAGALESADRLSGEGKTPLFFAEDGRLLGIIAAADRIKEESPEAVRQLRNMGVRVVMVTGDNERTAKAVGRAAGIDEVIAGVLPEEKEAAVRRYSGEGKVIMVGDGINDAPALAAADVGIAIGAGSEIAIDTADIVLMKNSLADVPAAIRMSRATLRNIRQNLFWAFLYNAAGIPLAAGVFISLTGWTMNPAFGAAAMSLSSFCVVTNALRLNLFDMYNPGNAELKKAESYNREAEPEKDSIEEEEKLMEKTMKIEGMMCRHCEARVKKTLESLECVEKAEVSYEEGKAVVELKKAVEDSVLKQAVEDQDYKVTEIF
ncbi:MAG: heavy metal translocating P-type ATPase [Bacillota bacterium]|nr:heavy metal translocating P-type ATPase [Bacillota bacterium]